MLGWKSEKSKRKPKTRNVHTQTDNGSPQQSSSPPSYPPPSVPQRSSSPPSYPPPPVPTSRAPTDKGKGIVIEEGKKRDKGKGIVIDDRKKQHSSDSDFDTRSERSGTSYIPQYASNVENPPPPSDPPSGYKFPYPYSENYNPQHEGYPTLSDSYYRSSYYYQFTSNHPDMAEIPEDQKLAHKIANDFF